MPPKSIVLLSLSTHFSPTGFIWCIVLTSSSSSTQAVMPKWCKCKNRNEHMSTMSMQSKLNWGNGPHTHTHKRLQTHTHTHAMRYQLMPLFLFFWHVLPMLFVWYSTTRNCSFGMHNINKCPVTGDEPRTAKQSDAKPAKWYTVLRFVYNRSETQWTRQRYYKQLAVLYKYCNRPASISSHSFQFDKTFRTHIYRNILFHFFVWFKLSKINWVIYFETKKKLPRNQSKGKVMCAQHWIFLSNFLI